MEAALKYLLWHFLFSQCWTDLAKQIWWTPKQCKYRLAVAQEVDTETQIAPDEQLAPCTPATVISVWIIVSHFGQKSVCLIPLNVNSIAAQQVPLSNDLFLLALPTVKKSFTYS